MGLWRSRWAAVGAAVAVACGAGGVGLVDAGLDTGDRPVTVTVEPERILDTRVALGLSGKFQHATPRDLQVTGSVPVASGGSKTVVPADAVGVLVNVTVVLPSDAGFLSLRPAGATGVPETSTVNFFPFTIEPNSATVDLSADGKIQVWVQTGDITTGTADVLVDVVGYTIDHTHDDRYYTETEVDDLLDDVVAGTFVGYENVIVVAKSGGDFTSVTAAMAAIGVDPGYPAASATERYLVWVAPGVYDGRVVMQPFVDIEGAGQGVTTLRSVSGAGGISPSAATLVGADNAELRNIRVEVEADAPGNWSHAIYTASSTRLRDVSAASSGGSRARGMVVATGGSPIMFDVALFASGGSVSNLGLDLFNSTAVADGLFADASGGAAATGVLLNNPTSEVRLENITVSASSASDSVIGLSVNNGLATLEGFRATVIGSPATAYGARCDGAGGQLTVLDGTIFVDNGSGSVRGVRAGNCDLELRNVVADAISAGVAIGLEHLQSVVGESANITLTDVEVRAESSGSSAQALSVRTTGGDGIFGQASGLSLRAIGGNPAAATWAVRHQAAGEVRYRDLSLVVGGVGGFMYGIQANDGSPRFHGITVDARATAEITVFGVELLTDGASLSSADVIAINTGTGDGRDAVGVKANGASGVSFIDVVAFAEAESIVWGADLVGSDSRLVRVDARAVSTAAAPGSALGARCWGGSAEIHDSVLHGRSATSSSYGLRSDECNSTVTGSELLADGGSTNFGLYADSVTGEMHSTQVVGSRLSGSTRSIWSQGSGVADISVVDSALEGGAALASGSTVHECLGVTYEAGGPAFLAGPAACP